MSYEMEPDGMASGESLYAIYEVGKHPDGGHPYVEYGMPLAFAEWMLDLLRSEPDRADALSAFVRDSEASWPAIQMGWAMERGTTYEQAAAAYVRRANADRPSRI